MLMSVGNQMKRVAYVPMCPQVPWFSQYECMQMSHIQAAHVTSVYNGHGLEKPPLQPLLNQ